MSWPLPLSREGLRQAAQNPVSQPMPSAAKRAAEEAKLPVSLLANMALSEMSCLQRKPVCSAQACSVSEVSAQTGCPGCPLLGLHRGAW